MSGQKIDNGDLIYNKGDIVELMYQVDPDTADLIGDTISVQITDVFDNVISTIIAERLQDLYIAEYTIPLTMEDLYNINNADETEYDSSLYYLKDKWNILGEIAEFTFIAIRAFESPTSDNSLISIKIDNLLSTDGSSTDAEEIKFTTKLDPFYCSPDDVKSIQRNALKNYNDIDVALDILSESRNIDYHMKPDVIIKQDQYDNAVKNYTALSIAKSYLNTEMNIQQELKQLDTLQINRTYGDTQRYLNVLDKDLQSYANIIYAGGEDTPFKTRTFIKGLFDPNRTNIARGSLDTSGYLPYVNTTTNNVVVYVDDIPIEVRGSRTISCKNYIQSEEIDV